MEILPSTNSLHLAATSEGIDNSQTSRSAAFHLRRSSKSFHNLRGKHRPRVSFTNNWFSSVSLAATTSNESYSARKKMVSAVVTLSPIAASPVCSPQLIYHREMSEPEVPPGSLACSAYMIAPTSTSHKLVATQLYSVDQPCMLKGPRGLPSTLATSTSFPYLTTPRATANLQDTEKPAVAMTQRPRSFSDSSLGPRLVAGYSFEGLTTTVAPSTGTVVLPQRRANFHIPHGPTVDDDEDYIEPANGERPQNDEGSKDKIRRFCALRELLTTEFAYLNDLRALVTVYLHSLSSMTDQAPYSLSDTGSLNINVHRKGCSKPALPELVSKDEFVVLRRNVETVLQFHERFFRELELIVEPFGITIESERGDGLPNVAILPYLDEAIQVVAQKFIKEAASFHVYQDYCAAHPDALEIVRTKQHRHRLEWDTFERHCVNVLSGNASIASELLSPKESPQDLCKTPSVKNRKRTASLTTLDGAFRSLRAFTSREQIPVQLNRNDGYMPRLALVDYMIKPIQRICKYPLLLAQLQRRSSLREINSNADTVVESSVKVMKDAVCAVDEARHRKDMESKSSLIASRILHLSVSGYPHHLSDVFLTSLGTCLLAGSLDVIRYSLTKPKNDPNTVKAKYLGAFLYTGGYLILVRVKGKIYEPRDWFSLADFDLRDITEDIALLSSSFCLFSDNVLFEFAASCPKEKDIWLKSIRESLEHTAIWACEPISSLSMDRSGPRSVEFETDNFSTLSNAKPCFPDQKSSQHGLDFPQINPSLRSESSVLSAQRAPSFVSLKAIFSQGNISDAIVVHHPSISMRQETDVGLQDVLSRACFCARAYNAGEELFQVPKAAGSFVRSSSSISMRSLARTGLSRLESVRMSRHNSSAGTTGRWELLEAKTRILRERTGENSYVEDYSASKQSLPSEVLKTTSLGYNTTNDDNSFTRALFYNLKGIFQSQPPSDVDPGVASHHSSGEKYPLFRAKTTSIFRRLSIKTPLDSGMSRSLGDARGRVDNGPELASATYSSKDIPVRRRTISRWPPTLDNVKRVSILQRFHN